MRILSFFLFVLLFFSSIYAEICKIEKKYTWGSPTLSCLSFDHVFGSGIGYCEGYSSVRYFSFPFCMENKGKWAPFIDLRAHVFDNVQFASNAGLGFRYTPCFKDYTFGFNLFYDYRHSDICNHEFSFHQLGIGLEFLSCPIDIYLNAYIPIDSEKIMCYCVFDHYSDAYYLEKKLVQVAFPGFSLEFGRQFCCSPCFETYVGAQGYLFKETLCETAFGGLFHLNTFFKKFLFIEGIISYDSLFETNFQAKIGLNICWGGRSCTQECCPSYRPIRRHEIIVLDEFCKWKWNF